MQRSERGRPTRGRHVSSRRTNSTSTPSVFSLNKKTLNQAFFMVCPHQDPDWCERAQLLLARDVEGNPGPMWYCAGCTHKITPYQTSIQCNHIITHWIRLKYSHQTQILLTLICMSRTLNPHSKNSFSHTHQQTKPITENQPIPPLAPPITTPNNINIMQLNINLITKKTTELTHLIHKQKIHIITLQGSNLNNKHKTPHILNFSAIRRDRPSSQKCGGSLTYINNNITYS